MNKPMEPSRDFSKPRTTAPPPTGDNRRRPSKAVLVAAALAVLAVGGAALAYSLVDKESKVSFPSSRFCEISPRFSQALVDAGVPPFGAIPESVPPTSIKKALDDLGGLVDELEAEAPPKIRNDVKRVIADLRAAAAGATNRVRATGFVEAEKRISVLQQGPLGCPQVGSAGGEG